MMHIALSEVTKKFGEQTVLKSISSEFKGGCQYAVTGPNGSGKSTLLKIVSGFLTPSSGTITYTSKNGQIPTTEIAGYVAMSAPYLELPEELTVRESVLFHSQLRPLEVTVPEFLELVELDPEKQIRHASSGMKQRLKLALACFTKAEVLLLDEPTANFDAHWKKWYLNVLDKQKEKLVIIGSNDPDEYPHVVANLSL